MRKQKQHKIIGCIDIESNTIKEGDSYYGRAYIYIISILDGELRLYSNTSCEEQTKIRYFGTCSQLFTYIRYLLDSVFCDSSIIPVLVVHNLSFDWSFMSAYVHKHWDVDILANGASSYMKFALKNKDTGELELVILDSLRLLGNESLAKVGQKVGYEKKVGDLDYSQFFEFNKLHEQWDSKEFEYANRDVMIPLLGIAQLLRNNPWLSDGKIGNSVITSTSVIRQFIRQLPSYNYLDNKYLLKKLYNNEETLLALLATGVGALTFVNKNEAGVIHDNVHVIDADSMHPGNMLCSRVYYNYFKTTKKNKQQEVIRKVINTPIEDYYKHIDNPFGFSFLGKFIFTNLRLKPPFDEICGTLSMHKVGDYEPSIYGEDDMTTGRKANQELRDKGYKYDGVNFTHLFGKIETADVFECWINEYTLYEMSLVYDWDNLMCSNLRVSFQSKPLPEYLLDSIRYFYKGKVKIKEFIKQYENYYYNKPNNIDFESIRGLLSDDYLASLQNKEVTLLDLQVYYTSVVKGGLNSHYGICFMKPVRGGIVWDETQGYTMQRKDLLDPEEVRSFIENPSGLSFYNLGSHTAQKSRIDLIYLIQELTKQGGVVLAGDTDSIYFTGEYDLDKINTMFKPRNNKCCELLGLDSKIGLFDYETTYDKCINYWNKARVCLKDGHLKIIMAGLPLDYTGKGVAGRLQYMLDNNLLDFDTIVNEYLGFNCIIDPELSNFLVKYVPSLITVDDDGEQRGIALVKQPRILGNTGVADLRDLGTGTIDNRMMVEFISKNPRSKINIGYKRLVAGKDGRGVDVQNYPQGL